MKGKNLLEKTLNKEKEFVASDLFGGAQILNNMNDDSEFNKFKEEKSKDSLKPKKDKVKLLTDEELNADYLNKLEPKKEIVEPIENQEDIYSDLFGSFEEFIPEEKNIIEEPPEVTVKEEVKEEEVLEEGSANAQIKELTESDRYPEYFPNYEEVLKLKEEHEDLIFVVSGNIFEQFHFELDPELFIATTLKADDYIFFKNKGGDEADAALWYPFIIDKCVLYPKIKFEDVFDTPAGTVKKLVDNILINSRYQTSVEVIKL